MNIYFETEATLAPFGFGIVQVNAEFDYDLERWEVLDARFDDSDDVHEIDLEDNLDVAELLGEMLDGHEATPSADEIAAHHRAAYEQHELDCQREREACYV